MALLRDLTDDEAREALVLKWGLTEPGVLPAWVAEMDYAVAEPVVAALHAAVDRGVLGYPEFVRAGGRLGEAYAALRPAPLRRGRAARPGPADRGRHRRRPDRPRRAQRAGADGAAAARPTTRSTGWARSPGWSSGTSRSTPTATATPSTSTRSTTCSARGARTLLLTQPHNPGGHVHTRAELEGIRDVVVQARRPRGERRDPRAAGPARRRARALPVARGHRRPRRRRGLGVQGVQHPGAQVRPDRHRRRRHPRPAGRAPDGPERVLGLARRRRLDRGVRRGRRLAGRARRAARPAAHPARAAPRRAPAAGADAPARGDLPGLARPSRVRPRRARPTSSCAAASGSRPGRPTGPGWPATSGSTSPPRRTG